MLDESAYKFQPIVDYDHATSSSSSSLPPQSTLSLLSQMDSANPMGFNDMDDDDFDMEISTFFCDISSPTRYCYYYYYYYCYYYFCYHHYRRSEEMGGDQSFVTANDFYMSP